MYKTTINTKMGKLTLLASTTGLRELYFENRAKEKNITASNSKQNDILKEAVKQLKEYFEHKRKTFKIPFDLEGTNFQKQAWLALTKIKYGTTISYKNQAKMIGNPKAYRAVGSANGKNPIPIMIPCHRVVSTNGLGGFSGGMHNKIFLLNHESE